MVYYTEDGQEIKYLVKNSKGFSVDDIKSKDIKEKYRKYYHFIGEKKQKYNVFISYVDSSMSYYPYYHLKIYKINSKTKEEKSFLEKDPSTFKELKVLLKKGMLNLGFKDPDSNLILKDNLILDLEENEPEYLTAFKTPDTQIFKEYFSEIKFFKNTTERKKIIEKNLEDIEKFVNRKKTEELKDKLSNLKRKFEILLHKDEVREYKTKEKALFEKNKEKLKKEFKDPIIREISLNWYETVLSNIGESSNFSKKYIQEELEKRKKIFFKFFPELNSKELEKIKLEGRDNFNEIVNKLLNKASNYKEILEVKGDLIHYLVSLIDDKINYPENFDKHHYKISFIKDGNVSSKKRLDISKIDYASELKELNLDYIVIKEINNLTPYNEVPVSKLYISKKFLQEKIEETFEGGRFSLSGLTFNLNDITSIEVNLGKREKILEIAEKTKDIIPKLKEDINIKDSYYNKAQGKREIQNTPFEIV